MHEPQINEIPIEDSDPDAFMQVCGDFYFGVMHRRMMAYYGASIATDQWLLIAWSQIGILFGEPIL